MSTKTVSPRVLAAVAAAALAVVGAVLFGVSEAVTVVIALLALASVGGALYLDKRARSGR